MAASFDLRVPIADCESSCEATFASHTVPPGNPEKPSDCVTPSKQPLRVSTNGTPVVFAAVGAISGDERACDPQTPETSQLLSELSTDTSPLLSEVSTIYSPASPLPQEQASSEPAGARPAARQSRRDALVRSLIGWTLLINVVLSFGLMAPITQMVPIPDHSRVVSSTLVAGWRLVWATLLLTPFSAVVLWCHGLHPHQKAFLRERAAWRSFLLTGLFCGANACCFNLSLAYTTIAQAIICMNLHPVMIIVWRLARAHPVSLGEFAGVACAMLGMGFIAAGAVDPGSDLEDLTRAGGQQVPLLRMLKGDLAGLVGAVSICLFVAETKRIGGRVPAYLSMNIQLAIGALVTLAGTWAFMGAQLNDNVWDGLLGFTHPVWAVSVCLGGTLTLSGWGGTNGVTNYLNSLVISTFLTLDPMCAVVLGVLMGVEAFPNLYTCVGICAVVVATGVVSASSRNECVDEAVDGVEASSAAMQSDVPRSREEVPSIASPASGAAIADTTAAADGLGTTR